MTEHALPLAQRDPPVHTHGQAAQAAQITYFENPDVRDFLVSQALLRLSDSARAELLADEG